MLSTLFSYSDLTVVAETSVPTLDPLVFEADPTQAFELTLAVLDVNGTPTVQILNQNAQPGSEVVASQAVADTSFVQITGSDFQDTLTIDSSVLPTITWTFSGGMGSDALVGADLLNNWAITGADTGTLNEQGFFSVENLSDGSASDNFVFGAGGATWGAAAARSSWIGFATVATSSSRPNAATTKRTSGTTCSTS